VDDAEKYEEGWYTDPYDRHEARWMSQGTPTALVRDGEVESQDPPPDTPRAHRPEAIMAESDGGADLRRADRAGGGETLSQWAADNTVVPIDPNF